MPENSSTGLNTAWKFFTSEEYLASIEPIESFVCCICPAHGSVHALAYELCTASEERTPRGILSSSLLSAVIAAAYRDPIVHTSALVHRRPRANSTTFHSCTPREDNNYFLRRPSIDANARERKGEVIGAPIVLSATSSRKQMYRRNGSSSAISEKSWNLQIEDSKSLASKHGKLFGKWKHRGNLGRMFRQRKIMPNFKVWNLKARALKASRLKALS